MSSKINKLRVNGALIAHALLLRVTYTFCVVRDVSVKLGLKPFDYKGWIRRKGRGDAWLFSAATEKK